MHGRMMIRPVAACASFLPSLVGVSDPTAEARLVSGTIVVDARGVPYKMRLDLELRLVGFPVVQTVNLSTRASSAAPWKVDELTRDSRGFYPAIVPYAEHPEYYIRVLTERGERLYVCSESKPCSWETTQLPRMMVDEGKHNGKKLGILGGGGFVAGLLAILASAGTVTAPPAAAGAGISPQPTPAPSTGPPPAIGGTWTGSGADGISFESVAGQPCSGRGTLTLRIAQNDSAIGGTFRMDVSGGTCVLVGMVVEGSINGSVNPLGEVSFSVDGSLMFTGAVVASRMNGTVGGVFPSLPALSIRGLWSVGQ